MAVPTIAFLLLLTVCSLSLATAIRLDPGTSTQLRNLKFSYNPYTPRSYDGYYDDSYGKPRGAYGEQYKHYGMPYEPIYYKYTPKYKHFYSPYKAAPTHGYYDPAIKRDHYYPAPKWDYYNHGYYQYPVHKNGYGSNGYDDYHPKGVKEVAYGCDPKEGYGCDSSHTGYTSAKPRDAWGYPAIERKGYYPSTKGYPSFGSYKKGPAYGSRPKYPLHGLDNKADFSSNGMHNLYGEGDIAQKYYGDSKSTAYGTDQNAGAFGSSKAKGHFHGNLDTELDASTINPYGRRNEVWEKAFNKVATKGYAKTDYLNDLSSSTTGDEARTKGVAANKLQGQGHLSAAGGLSGGTSSTGYKTEHNAP